MSPSSDDPRPSAPAAGKPTLEMLLRVKRAERPDPAFWADFERGFRQKQLAASIEPRPWWLGLSILSRRLAPLGLPVSAGAAALLAVMVVRTQMPGSLASSGQDEIASLAVATPALASASRAPGSPADASRTLSTANRPEPRVPVTPSALEELPEAPTYVAAASSMLPEPAPLIVRERERELANASASAPTSVAASLLALPDKAPTPSQLTIAQNLETVRAEEPELIAAAAPGFARLGEAAVAAVDEAASEISRAINPRQARLLAMADYSASQGTDLATVRERMVHRLAHDDTNYGSSSRLAAAGDRFSLSF